MAVPDGNRVASPEREPVFWRIAALAFAVCMVVMVLSLPMFPSQDGPVHLYYVDVLRGLFTHSGPYVEYFEIKSYLTPYVLEYYSLLALETVFSPLVSEKLLICGYVLLFILGFQYLVESVTNAPGPWLLAGVPFCLNLYVYMGFLNYAYATALALALSGCWIRWMKRLTARRIVTLVGGLVLILLTHPLPGAVFLVFCALHVAVNIISSRSSRAIPLHTMLLSYRRPLVMLALMGLAAGAWVVHFTGESQGTTRVVKVPAPAGFFRTVYTEFTFGTLSPLLAARYRAVLLLLTISVCIALSIALWRRRGRIPLSAASMAGLASICLAMRLAAPSMINDTGLFRERFSIFWVLFLIAIAAAAEPPRRYTAALGICAIAAATVLLFSQWHYLSSTARLLDSAINAPLVNPGSIGVVISENPRVSRQSFSDPYMWGSAHFFRNSKAILANAPWTQLRYIMLGPKHANQWTYADDPNQVLPAMLETVRRTGTVPIDLAVRIHPEGPGMREAMMWLGFETLRDSEAFAFYSRPGATRLGQRSKPATREHLKSGHLEVLQTRRDENRARLLDASASQSGR